MVDRMVCCRFVFKPENSSELLAQAAFFWPAALMTRATCEAGSASTRTSMVAGCTITLSSMDSACSRVGNEASTSTCEAGYALPPMDTSFGFSLSFALAYSFTSRPAAPGSSVEKAYSSGPVSCAFAHSYSVPSTARRTSVFLTTFKYTPDSRAFLRSSVSCPTVRPAYSAATSECALAATFASSATSSFLLARLSGIAFSEPDSLRAPRAMNPNHADHPNPFRSADALRRQTRWPLWINLSRDLKAALFKPPFKQTLCGRHHLRRLKVLAKPRLRLADRAAGPRIACGL